MSTVVDSGVFTAPDGNTNPFSSTNGGPVSQGVNTIQLKNLGPGQAFVGKLAGDATNMYPLDVGEPIALQILGPKALGVRMTAASKMAWILLGNA